MKPLAERFWAKVDVRGPDECWEWQATSRLPRGYGFIGLGRAKDGKELSHRVAYKLGVGEIPPGSFVCHKCDNPACCNPAHLFLGTHEANMADMVSKGRSQLGERNPQAKLTAEQVAEIRERAARGEVQRQLAREYGVTPSIICNIVKRKIWKSVA